MATATRESFLNLSGPKVHKVEGVPEDFGDVYVRGWTVSERDAFEEEFKAVKDAGLPWKLRPRLITRTVCDENGNLIFQPGDEVKVDAMPNQVMQPIWNLALSVAGMSDRDVEDLEKNSSETANGDSSSA